MMGIIASKHTLSHQTQEEYHLVKFLCAVISLLVRGTRSRHCSCPTGDLRELSAKAIIWRGSGVPHTRDASQTAQHLRKEAVRDVLLNGTVTSALALDRSLRHRRAHRTCGLRLVWFVGCQSREHGRSRSGGHGPRRWDSSCSSSTWCLTTER